MQNRKPGVQGNETVAAEANLFWSQLYQQVEVDCALAAHQLQLTICNWGSVPRHLQWASALGICDWDLQLKSATGEPTAAVSCCCCLDRTVELMHTKLPGNWYTSAGQRPLVTFISCLLNPGSWAMGSLSSPVNRLATEPATTWAASP